MNAADCSNLQKMVDDTIGSLRKAQDKIGAAEKALQDIGKELLTKYEIRLDNILIEPLRVEAYLFMEGFQDKFIHYEKNSENDIVFGPNQRNRFGKLYIHKGFAGVDIVLSDSEDYALSFLIKNARISHGDTVDLPFVKQIEVAKILKEKVASTDYNEQALYNKRKPNDTEVFKTSRCGLEIKPRDYFPISEQEKYNHLLISSFIELKEHAPCFCYDFESGFGAGRAVVEYLKDYREKNPDTSIEELDNMRKKLFPNGDKAEFNKAFKE